MKTFFLILLISLQPISRQFKLQQRCDGEGKSCELFNGTLSIDEEGKVLHFRAIDKPPWNLRLSNHRNSLHSNGEYNYFLQRDTLVNDTLYWLYRGKMKIIPQANKIELILFVSGPEVRPFACEYRYSKSNLPEDENDKEK